MSKRIGLCCAALALAVLPACGDTSISIGADKTNITAGGIDFATITARAVLSGDPVPQGTTINFTTTEGSFAANESLTSTSAAADGSGTAKVRLYSSDKQVTATVTADFYDTTSGLSASASVSITFGPPTGNQLPVDGTFRMTCDAVNIGALREPVPDINVTCELNAQTRNGTSIPAVALNPEFRTEAGQITPSSDTSSGKLVFIYSPKGGSSAPDDVDPDNSVGEPSYADSNGRTRNPRDGLVTIIAVVDGEEAFSDTNGNGKYDVGEPFEDAAEPFVDANDNDQWDVGEPFIDANGDGKWDPANGQWDARTKIMAVYKILWTGPLHSSAQTSRIDRLSSSIPDGGKLELKAYALDINMNPVAAFQTNQDYLEWTLTSGGDALSNDPTSPPATNALGFSFDKSASNERKRWLIVSNTFKPTPFTFTVEDGFPGDGQPAPTSFTVSLSMYASPGPGGDGYFLPQVTESFDDRVQGTCD
ncbi:MAG: hypothetical protein KC503_30720 [Myxococcales bacterium]|nr:hypothetical protein [Myxococcales bacterium]